MPSEEAIDKAARLLKGNAVQIEATARIYKVGITDPYTVRVLSDGGNTWWECNCHHGVNNSPMHDVEHICEHVIAVIEFDDRLMESMHQKYKMVNK